MPQGKALVWLFGFWANLAPFFLKENSWAQNCGYYTWVFGRHYLKFGQSESLQGKQWAVFVTGDEGQVFEQN